MTTLVRTLSTIVLALVSGGTNAAETSTPPDAAPSQATVATIGGNAITAAELEDAIGNRLLNLRTEEYQATLGILHEVIGERLLTREAESRKLSLEDLLKFEVQDKVAPVAEAEINGTFEAVKERQKDMPEAELKQRIQENIRRQREQARRNAFLRELRDRSEVRVLLEPPRVAVSEGGSPSRGPKDAPVTIVEFSDFQCPYCARVQPTFKKLHETYGDKIRVVFRHFPLGNHPQAPKAAEASACAHDQGKFWEMHDKLFATQQKLMVPDLKAAAGEIGLEAEAFALCLDSGKHEATWKGDEADGERYGVTGTPASFVNGRLVGGAQPYESFAQIIDDELRRKAAVAQGK